MHNGNLALEDVIEIARIMRDRSCAATLAGTVKEILGTCVSVGCTVDNEEPRDVQSKIDEGEVEVRRANPAAAPAPAACSVCEACEAHGRARRPAGAGGGSASACGAGRSCPSGRARAAGSGAERE